MKKFSDLDNPCFHTSFLFVFLFVSLRGFFYSLLLTKEDTIRGISLQILIQKSRFLEFLPYPLRFLGFFLTERDAI